MSTTTKRRMVWLLAIGLSVSLSVAGCAGASGDPAAGGSTPPPPPRSSAAVDSAAPSPPSSTTEATTTAAPVPSDATRTRAASEVSIALLDTNSFIAGVHEVAAPAGSPGQTGGSDSGPVVTSKDPRCANFVRDSNSSGNAGQSGVTGHATITFQADGDPMPFLVEEITTVGTAERAAAALVALDQSSRGCSKVTMSIPGVGPSTMTVSSVTPPPHGEHPTALRLVGTTGPLRGLEMTLVATQVEDAVIMLNFIQESESDIQGITDSAVERATAVFSSVKPS